MPTRTRVRKLIPGTIIPEGAVIGRLPGGRFFASRLLTPAEIIAVSRHPHHLSSPLEDLEEPGGDQSVLAPPGSSRRAS